MQEILASVIMQIILSTFFFSSLGILASLYIVFIYLFYVSARHALQKLGAWHSSNSKKTTKKRKKKSQSPRKRNWNVYVREYVKKEWGIGLGKRKAKGWYLRNFERERERGERQPKKTYHMIGCVSGYIYCIKLHAMLSFHLPKNLSIPPLFESVVTGIFRDQRPEVSIKRAWTEFLKLMGSTLLLHSHLLSFHFFSHSHPKGKEFFTFLSSCLSFSYNMT